MHYVQLIYNPMAGQRVFHIHLDYFIEKFQSHGYEVRMHRTSGSEDFANFFLGRDMTGCAAVIVAGGDGSVNQVVNAMMKEDMDIPIGVVPAGTANDFAVHIGLPLVQREAIDMLSDFNVGHMDIGKANGRYFINVLAGGLFSNISQNIDLELKNTLGKMAYYIKGVQQLPSFSRLKLKVTYEEGIVIDDFYLFLLLNGSSAGGFIKLGHDADINDGAMDFVGIRACHVGEIPQLFGKILLGEHLTDKNVLFFKSGKMTIECLEGSPGFEETDVDGETGPAFPLEIEVLHNRLKILRSK